MNWFRAKFAAACALCRDKIHVGDWCRYDEDKQLICRSCGEDEE